MYRNNIFEILKINSSTIKMMNIKYEPYNQDYDAFLFEVHGETIRHRLAKLTPKKKGFFVTLWTKENHTNRAFRYEESTNKLVITVIDTMKIGQFIFPKDILREKNILSSPSTQGKMGFRVYAPWEVDLNTTALNTKNWQSKYFVDLSNQYDANELLNLYIK